MKNKQINEKRVDNTPLDSVKIKQFVIKQLIFRIGIVGGLINLLDVVMTFCFYEAEVNPLVLAYPEYFYPIKMFMLVVLISMGWHGLARANLNEKLLRGLI